MFETELKMANFEFARRTWRVLRVALLFNRRLIKDLRRSVKSIGGEKRLPDRYNIGERQFSFDNTPLFQAKMYRPASKSMRFLFPCINSGPEWDCGFDGGYWEEYYLSDDEIDSRAQKFIDEFHEGIKSQRHNIRYLQSENCIFELGFSDRSDCFSSELEKLDDYM